MENKDYKRTSLIFFAIIVGLSSSSCVETFDFDSEIEGFENVLVVEATITNELKQQQVVLSNTIQLSEQGFSPERDAQVKIIDNSNNEYVFEESDSVGVYKSIQPFAAQNDQEYTLLITRNDGTEYLSSSVKLTQNTPIDNLYAERDFNENGQDGISIYVDSYDPERNTNYYRFEYEETYKIIAPFWVLEDLIVENTRLPLFGLIPRSRDIEICYNTEISDEIIIENTTNLNADRLDKFRVRFISSENYILSHRYSILVKQYVQSRAAHVFYKILKEISESESLFSEKQPGFINGNIYATNKSQEKALGFFDLSYVDTKRIYFNYDHFFPEQDQLPPYAVACTFIAPLTAHPTFSDGPSPLIEVLTEDLFIYYGENTLGGNDGGPYLLVKKACGDCSVLGKTEAPDFWVE